MNKIVFFLLCLIPGFAFSQLLSVKESFSKEDTLRGTNTRYRDWWNVTHYDITVEPDYYSGIISGTAKISFFVEKVSPQGILQVDLQEPLHINKIELESKGEIYEVMQKDIQKTGNVYLLPLGKYIKMKKDDKVKLIISYSGNPRMAVNPPWDGGWIFTTDDHKSLWMTVVCQGLGASVWYPCKDYPGDEPEEGMDQTIITPEELKGVGNGHLVSEKMLGNGRKMYHWRVISPINTYNIIPYIGDYVHFSDSYPGEKGNLTLDYWVLPYNLEKAKKHFKEVNRMLEAFEYWFGPYPFYKDGYKLVEAPYLGMEHQSGIAYGNKYLKGYLGSDRSNSGEGLKWDFIIVHESGHEWFGNSITCKDIADMWIHEAFTTYSETLFTEYFYGKEAASRYIIGQRANIRNDIPIIGQYGVNKEGSSDMYDKGANMLHTIRQIMNDDIKFRSILRGVNEDFYHQTVTTLQIENYISEKSGIDFSKVFDQYLRTVQIPLLEYSVVGEVLKYRWKYVVPGFNMKIDTSWGALEPSEDWKEFKYTGKQIKFRINSNYYVRSKTE